MSSIRDRIGEKARTFYLFQLSITTSRAPGFPLGLQATFFTDPTIEAKARLWSQAVSHKVRAILEHDQCVVSPYHTANGRELGVPCQNDEGISMPKFKLIAATIPEIEAFKTRAL